MLWHMGGPPLSPDVEVYEVSIESVAVVVQQVVPFHSKHHDGRLETVEQWFHPFDAGLFMPKKCQSAVSFVVYIRRRL